MAEVSLLEGSSRDYEGLLELCASYAFADTGWDGCTMPAMCWPSLSGLSSSSVCFGMFRVVRLPMELQGHST